MAAAQQTFGSSPSATDNDLTNEKGMATYSDDVSNKNAVNNMFLNAASASGL